MKLAIVLFSYFPYGGLQRDFLRIVQACVDRGAQVTILCMEWQGDRPAGVKIVTPALSGFFRTGKIQCFVGRCQALTEGKYDAVIGFNKMPGLDYYFAADSCFAEKAYIERNWLYRLTPRCRQYLTFETSVFAKSSKTKILFISSRQKQQFLGHYQIDQSRYVELPPGIDKNRKAADNSVQLRQGFRQEFGLTENDFLLLQIGSGFAIKGVDRSLLALASLPEGILRRTHFFLVGQDKPDQYLSLAKKLGLQDNFRVFPGRDDIPNFLQGADLLLHPAYQESAGLVLLEAVVAGLPVLTTDTCGYADHVSRAKAGLVCESPFRQEELNSFLLDMLTSEDSEQWRENGITYGLREDLYNLPEKVTEILFSHKK